MMEFEHDWKKFPELTNEQMKVLELMSPHKQIKDNFFAHVVEVHDGDTITVTCDFRDFAFPVRFLDIDSKELGEGGEEAREWLKTKIQGEDVQILIDPENRVGKYGRLLGRVLYRGLVLGDEEIYLGLALPFGAKKEGEPRAIEKIFSPKQWFG